MSFLSEFDPDVLISYKHTDNQNGWVTEFHRRLQVRLTELLGKQATVWIDSKLGGSDDFAEEIGHQLTKTAILVPVLSPGYALSEWCKKEFSEFRSMADKNGGFKVGRKIRVVKAVKTPLEEDKHRQILNEALGFEFYERTQGSNYFREFSLETQAFNDKLDSMAQEIHKILLSMRDLGKRKERKKLTVYVAETSSDVDVWRDKIVQELQAQAYRVLPESTLPDDDEGYAVEVEKALAEAKVSIHLLGEKFKASVRAQYETAKKQDTLRIVWFSNSIQITQEKQVDFIKSLREEDQHNLELLENKDFDELKQVILDKLNLQTTLQPVVIDADRLIRIYLMCDREDHPLLHHEPNNALQLRNYLMGQEGFEVKLPSASEVVPAEVRRDNREKLKQCDAVLLYWGSASQTWVDEKLRELSQALGWRRSKTFTSKAIYASTPPDTIKKNFETLEAIIIRDFEGFTAQNLAPFLAPLRKRKETRA